MNEISLAETVEEEVGEELPPLLTNIKKLPLPLDIRKSMWDSCSSLGDGFSKEEKEFWKTLHIKLISITPEFKSVNGKLSSITIQSAISATSCPPLTGLNGTFASANGEEHRFRLEYNGDIFKYQIDDIFPPQYEGVMESPLKQFKAGIPWDVIQCKENLVLVLKSSDGSPACVKTETVQKLIERGWAIK